MISQAAAAILRGMKESRGAEVRMRQLLLAKLPHDKPDALDDIIQCRDRGLLTISS
jgi:hypothetical protein